MDGVIFLKLLSYFDEKQPGKTGLFDADSLPAL